MNEIIELLDIKPEPLKEDGWSSFSEIFEEVKSMGIKEKPLRDKLQALVEKGLMEKVYWGKNTYYRKAK